MWYNIKKRNRLIARKPALPKGDNFMKKFLKVIAAAAAIAGALFLLKFAAEVLCSCRHRYFEVGE